MSGDDDRNDNTGKVRHAVDKQAPDVAASPDDLDHRLGALGDRLSGARAEIVQKEQGDKASLRSGIGQAMRLSSEFIAGVCVGAALGFGIDWLFGTSPWGMIVFLLLGFAAAVLNVMRAAGLVAQSGMRVKKNTGTK
jgi:ATP synthase protein I